MKILDLLIRPAGGNFRTKTFVALFSGDLKRNQKIIDIGAGSCLIAKYIRDKFQTNITPIDVVDYNKTNLKLVLYNGEKIPFENQTFDIALIIFVLHHSKDQETILNEAKRVAKRIIILEDTPKNKLEKLLWHFWDWLLNLGHDVKMSYSARTDEEWLVLFEEMNFKVIKKKNFRSALPILWSYQQSMFILENK